MHAMLPLLQPTDFPALTRRSVSTLQVNLGYVCNQTCLHCHVNAGPNRKEIMDKTTIDLVLKTLIDQNIQTLDLTGGAPELNPHFRELVTGARAAGVTVIDRCNLTILNEPGMETLAEFLAQESVEIVASLPCYEAENVDAQRGKGVHHGSITGLKKLNALGYGQADSGLIINLIYNPTGAYLPPAQDALQADYKRELEQRFDLVFNALFTITNMPIARFGSTLVSKGQFHEYIRTLRTAMQPQNLDTVMCKDLVSVDYQGYIYDCDFNQMLDLPILGDTDHLHLRDLPTLLETENDIQIADHCYGCTAGQGSSCGGALD